MVIAFGLSCCSAALIVLSPVAATDRAIAVIVSFMYFMVFLQDYRLAASRAHTQPYRRATGTRWQDGRRPGRPHLWRCRSVSRSHVHFALRPRSHNSKAAAKGCMTPG